MERKIIYASDAAEAVSKAYNIPLHELVDLFAEIQTVEPKQGKWIPQPKLGDCIYKCPFCEKIVDTYLEDYNFCPNCGADMRGEEDEK